MINHLANQGATTRNGFIAAKSLMLTCPLLQLHFAQREHGSAASRPDPTLSLRCNGFGCACCSGVGGCCNCRCARSQCLRGGVTSRTDAVPSFGGISPALLRKTRDEVNKWASVGDRESIASQPAGARAQHRWPRTPRTVSPSSTNHDVRRKHGGGRRLERKATATGRSGGSNRVMFGERYIKASAQDRSVLSWCVCRSVLSSV